MTKPICVPCQRVYRPETNGIFFTEGMPIGANVLPGTAEPEKWQPYKLWCGDKWKCQGCGAEIIVGTGHGPVAEHYQDDFTDLAKRYGGDKLQINDC